MSRMLLTAKVPQHSEEAEMSVLGGIMLEARAIFDICDRISEADFYFEKHRLIYRALLELTAKNRPCDFVTVSDHLRNAGKLDEVDGMAYLGQLVNDTPGAANVAEYARIVRERAVLRGLAAAGDAITGLATRPEGRSADDIMDTAERSLLDLRSSNSRGRGGLRSVSEGTQKAIAEIEAAHRSGGSPQGLRTGYSDLDRAVPGLEPGDLIIVAGRPSMGKTSLAMCIAEHVALVQRKSVAVFSLEMGEAALAKRLLSSLTGISFTDLKSGTLTDSQWAQLSDAQRCLEEAPLFIDETGGLSPMDLRSRARRIAGHHGLGLIVVDYIQLMHIPGSENRTNEVSEISRSLKSLAKELKCPVIALSQLNRGLETRDNKRPRMSDLRESGGIEQDADVIAFVYRDEVYFPESPDAGTAEIIIAKQRNGPLGVVRLAARLCVTRFDNLAPGWQPLRSAVVTSRPKRGFSGHRPAAGTAEPLSGDYP